MGDGGAGGGGGSGLKNFCFRPFGLQFGLKIKGGEDFPSPSPGSSTAKDIHIPSLFQAFRLWSVPFSLLTSLCVVSTILTPGAGYQTSQS